MKKIVLLLATAVLSAMMFVTPVFALEKLHSNATKHQTYAYALELRKRLEKVPENQIDGLRNTINDYIGHNGLADELICEAKANRGNPDFQIELAKSYAVCTDIHLYRKHNDDYDYYGLKPIEDSVLLQYECAEIGLTEGSEKYRNYCFVKAKSLLEKVLSNPKADITKKCEALNCLYMTTVIYAGFTGNWEFRKTLSGGSLPSLQERLKILDQAKQYALQEKQLAFQAKYRAGYRHGQMLVQDAEKLKKRLIDDDRQNNNIKNFLQ